MVLDHVDETETLSLESYLRQEMRPLDDASIREAATAAMQPVQEALLANLQAIVQENFERALDRYRGLYGTDSPGSSVQRRGIAPAIPLRIESDADLESSGSRFPSALGLDGVADPVSWLPPGIDSQSGIGAGSGDFFVLDFDPDDYEWTIPQESFDPGWLS